jgi:hypothetical protein
MSSALAIPARVREEWASEVEADNRAAQVVLDKQALDARRAEEAPVVLAAATKVYRDARAKVEFAIDGGSMKIPADTATTLTFPSLLDAVRECAQARVEYEAAFGIALKYDAVRDVRIAPLQRNEDLLSVMHIAGRL